MSTIDDVSATITADSSGYTAAMNNMRSLTSSSTSSMSSSLNLISSIIGVAIPTSLAALGAMAVQSFNSSAVAATTMSTEIANTGDVVGWTSAQLEAMAGNLSNVSQFGQEDIMENVTMSLMKFGSIAGDTFSRVQSDVLDLAASMGGNLAAATSEVGRLMQNPLMATRNLGSSIVDLTAKQKEQIKEDIEAGNQAKAQGIILDGLEAKYKGLAAAQAALPGAQIAKDMADIDNNLAPMGKIIETALVPLFNMVYNLSVAFKNASPAVQTFVTVLGVIVAVVVPVITFFGTISTACVALAANFAAFSAGVLALGASFVELVDAAAPWLAVAAAVIYTGQVIYDNWKSLVAEGKAVVDAFLGMKAAAQGYTEAASTDFSNLQKDMATSMNSTVSLGTSFTNLKANIGTAVSSVTALVSGMATKIVASNTAVGKSTNDTGKQTVESWTNTFNTITPFAETFMKTMESSMTDMMTTIVSSIANGGANWEAAFSKILNSMITMISQWAVEEVIKILKVAEAMNALFTADPILGVVLVAGILASLMAAGAIISPPAQAMGGVFDKATTVTVGEAGPEVILPVTRLSNGKMGVGTTAPNGMSVGSGGGASSGSSSSSQDGVMVVQVNLDSSPILKAVSKASRTGKLVIHPNAVRIQAVN